MFHVLVNFQLSSVPCFLSNTVQTVYTAVLCPSINQPYIGTSLKLNTTFTVHLPKTALNLAITNLP